MRRVFLLLTLCASCAPAAASSDLAWRQLQQRVERKCIAASGHLRPRVSNPITFSDAKAQVALLVAGTHAEPRLRGVPVTSLCLHDRRTGSVELQEAAGWREQRP